MNVSNVLAFTLLIFFVMTATLSFAQESKQYENHFRDLGLPNARSLEMIEKYETSGSMSTKILTKRMKVKSVCLFIASLPWRYGPYQNQGYKLSLGLAKAGLKVYWMSFSSQHAIPKGVYKNVEELNRAVHLDYPPDDFGDVSHLTYLGYGRGMDSNMLLVSDLNDRANQYGFDSYIILTDSNRLSRDAAYMNVRTLFWLPYHHPTLKPLDEHTLKAMSTTVSLSPTMAAAMSDELPHAYIPHIMNIPEYNEQRASRRVLGIPEDAFVVLAQGGNYEEYDRKGWNQILQSFAKFYETHPNAFLYIHAIGWRAIAEIEVGKTPPPNLMEKGVRLHIMLRDMKLPPNSYKLVTKIFDDPRDSMAMKVVADVCLHPSRVEGFGLNVIECQGLGTPVITTNFTAMGDFTKLGISVPPIHYELVEGGTVATPDVNGVAKALDAIYNDLQNEIQSRKIVTEKKIQEAKDWIENHFTKDKVVNAFLYLLRHAKKPSRSKHPEVSFVCDMMDLPDAPWVLVYDCENVEIDQDEMRALVKSQKNWENLPPINFIPIRGATDNDQRDVIWERSTTPFAVLMKSYLYLQGTTIFGPVRLRLGWSMSKVQGKVGTIPVDRIARYSPRWNADGNRNEL